MMCPKCADALQQLTAGTYRCEADELIVTVGTEDGDEEPEPSPPDVPGCTALDVGPGGIRRGDLIVVNLKLRKVIDLHAPGWSGKRWLRFRGGGSYLMQGRERVYRANEP